MKYYAVHIGHKPGVYTSWDETLKKVKNFPGAKFKSFQNKEEAINFYKYGTYKLEPFIDLEDVDLDAFNCFADGGSRSYGTLGVYAAYSYKVTRNFTDLFEDTVFVKDKTNNFTELSAVNALLQKMENSCLLQQGTPLNIFTDSAYTINCITTYLPKWEKNGFKTKSGVPVLNREIIEEIGRIYRKGNIRFIHIPSHTKFPEKESIGSRFIWTCNDAVDRNCTKAIKAHFEKDYAKLNLRKFN